MTSARGPSAGSILGSMNGRGHARRCRGRGQPCPGAGPDRGQREGRGSRPGPVTLVAVSKSQTAGADRGGARGGAARVRRELRAGGGRPLARAAPTPCRHRAAHDRRPAEQQGRRGRGPVRRHPDGRPAAAGAGAGQGDGAAGPTAAAADPGQHRRGAAEGGRGAGRATGPPCHLPGRARPARPGPDGDPARGRRRGAARGPAHQARTAARPGRPSASA